MTNSDIEKFADASDVWIIEQTDAKGRNNSLNSKYGADYVIEVTRIRIKLPIDKVFELIHNNGNAPRSLYPGPWMKLYAKAA